jgi:ribosomal protein RSM22 (predicted rRNA methylase)
MQLPFALREAIDREATGVAGLREAARAISDAYRGGKPPRLDSDAACAAYAATRLPATYAAAYRSLLEIDGAIESVVDLGAGAGAASWAAAELFPRAAFTLVEQNPRLLDWSRRLGRAEWSRVAANLEAFDPPGADLILFSYSLGELRQPLEALDRAWRAARKVLAVIEPGTKAGFALVHRMRSHLQEHVAAPCPQRGACPMHAAGDWCHFAARVERTALHRRLKEGALSHEDEKFSYVVFAKEPALLPEARIVRHPLIEPGRIELALCGVDGLRKARVAKRDAAWKAARKAEWGERWRAVSPEVE